MNGGVEQQRVKSSSYAVIWVGGVKPTPKEELFPLSYCVLSNIIEYCIKEHKTGQAGIGANNSATVRRNIATKGMRHICSDNIYL